MNARDLLSSLTEDGESNASRKLVRSLTRGGAEELAELLVALKLTINDLEEKLEENDARLDKVIDLLNLIDLPFVTALANEKVLPERVEINAEMAFGSADGFYGIEYDGDGRSYRWAGLSEVPTSFSFPIDRRSDKVLTLTLLKSGPIEDETNGHPEFYLDGLPAALKRTETDDVVSYSTELPLDKKSSLTRFSFRYPTWKPNDLDEEVTDTRDLSVPFCSLTVSSSDVADHG